ncbi:unnamed protein product, partial [Laminaria digitata]
MEPMRIEGIIPAGPDRVYQAWLDSDQHTAFTGGSKADIIPEVGKEYTAYDGQVTGKTVKLDRNKRIVQSWKHVDFPPDAKDSTVEIQLT